MESILTSLEVPEGFTNDIENKKRALEAGDGAFVSSEVFHTIFGAGKIIRADIGPNKDIKDTSLTIEFQGGAKKTFVLGHAAVYIKPQENGPAQDDLLNETFDQSAALEAAVIKPGYLVFVESKAELGPGRVEEIENKGGERLLISVLYSHQNSRGFQRLSFDLTKESLIIIGPKIDDSTLRKATPSQSYLFAVCGEEKRKELRERGKEALAKFGEPKLLTDDELQTLRKIAMFKEISAAERQASESDETSTKRRVAAKYDPLEDLGKTSSNGVKHVSSARKIGATPKSISKKPIQLEHAPEKEVITASSDLLQLVEVEEAAKAALDSLRLIGRVLTPSMGVNNAITNGLVIYAERIVNSLRPLVRSPKDGGIVFQGELLKEALQNGPQNGKTSFELLTGLCLGGEIHQGIRYPSLAHFLSRSLVKAAMDDSRFTDHLEKRSAQKLFRLKCMEIALDAYPSELKSAFVASYTELPLETDSPSSILEFITREPSTGEKVVKHKESAIDAPARHELRGVYKERSLTKMERQTVEAILTLNGHIQRNDLSSALGINSSALNQRLEKLFAKFPDVLGQVRSKKIDALRAYLMEHN